MIIFFFLSFSLFEKASAYSPQGPDMFSSALNGGNGPVNFGDSQHSFSPQVQHSISHQYFPPQVQQTIHKVEHTISQPIQQQVQHTITQIQQQPAYHQVQQSVQLHHPYNQQIQQGYQVSQHVQQIPQSFAQNSVQQTILQNMQMSSQLQQLGKYSGGCGKPPAPSQSSLQCSPGVGTCFVNCKEGHAFPDGRVRTVLQCQNGDWMEQNAQPGDEIPDCLPVCSPPCMNRGVCIHPDTCSCQPGFTGTFCESVVEPPCSRTPPSPKNSRIVCNSRECTATCLPGNLFPGQLERIHLQCEDGDWVYRSSSVIPDCQSHCEPACENGGTCLSPGTCLCPRGYKGQACQYESGNCTPEKLGFNGGYNCTSTQYQQQCVLICPAGIQFSSPPAPVYTCDFSTGQYQPYPPPTCLFDPGMKIKREGSSYYGSSSMGHYTSSSFSFTQVMSVNYMHETWIRECNLDWRPGQGMIPYSPQSYAALSTLTTTEIKQMIRGQGAWLSFSHPINLFSEERKRLEYLLSQGSKKQIGTCYIWAGHHFRTFDGNVFSIPDGEYIALLEPRDHTVQISIQHDPIHQGTLKIYLILEDQQVELSLDNLGQPRATSAGSSLQLPGSQDGIVFHKSGNWVFVEILGLGLTLRWNSKDFIAIDAETNNWNRTMGLCGSLTNNIFDDFYCVDGEPADLIQFVHKYAVKNDREVRSTDDSDRCASNASLKKRAKSFCKQILTSPDLVDCQAAVSPMPFYEACKKTFCQDEDKACESVEAYVKVCQRRGMQISTWRKPGFCTTQCQAGLEFRECGFGVSPACGENFDWDDIEFCIPGCYCPHGTRLHNGSCIPVEDCPCENNNQFYSEGQTIRRDCNTCVCSRSRWVCTSEVCSRRCTLDSQHSLISTFSGQLISFDGSCEYTIFSSQDAVVRVELQHCPSQFHTSSYSVSSVLTAPSICIRRVSIRLDESVIKLGLHHEVLIDGDEILFPLETDAYTINHPSSLWTTVELSNEVLILWNGNDKLYIDVPPTMLGMVKGMCGAFTKNAEDAFLTPDGDVEENPIDFINRWRVDMRCPDAKEFDDLTAQDSNLLEQAKQFCSNIKSDIFLDCHSQVDPEEGYESCVNSYHTCQTSDRDCQCSLLASYADSCASKDVSIDWRSKMSSCSLRCDTGLHFSSCGNKDIGYSCRSIALQESHDICLEGCYCPSGLLLDDSGNCIPVSSCTCVGQDGSTHKPLSQDYRESSNEICVCENAKWNCRTATVDDKDAWIRSQHKCRSNQQFTKCLTPSLTCQNMHTFVEREVNETDCHPGCTCSPGYVESESGDCILPTNCPCHHGGRSYKDGQIVHKDCNECLCNDGIWSCSTRDCPGICSTWGEGHFITFDKKNYDVLGSCDYTLAKGTLSSSDTFSISMKNVPCGTSRVICAKAVQVTVGKGNQKEVISLNKDGDWLNDRKYKRIQITDTGLYLWLDVHDLGLTIQWDKGNKLYIILQPRWKGSIQGLCGNFNGDSGDDLRSPGGVTESSVLSFVDSWRLHSYCPRAEVQKDTCSLFPHRKLWASKKCGVLKSALFQPCHNEVPLKPWFERCIKDTCGCNVGGDCECMCTALSAYAHACARAGVNIKWRAPGLCALQCPDRHSYTTCAPRCPLKTCHNYMKYTRISQKCTDSTCTEGCQPDSCTDDRIFQDAKNATCILKSECKPKCLVEDDVQYYDGDIMSKSSCEICKCHGHSKVCEDLCGSQSEQQSSAPYQPEVYGGESSSLVISCRPGWTDWISATQPTLHTTPLTFVSGSLGGWCGREEVEKMQCRGSQSDQITDCSSPTLQLPCSQEDCQDMKYRVLCQCKADQTLMNITVEEISGLVNCQQNVPLPNLNSCKLYYTCHKGPSGLASLVEKECSSGELFDITDLTCKHSQIVQQNRPQCSEIATVHTDTCVEAIKELEKLGDSLIKNLEQEQDASYISSMSQEWSALKAMQSSLNNHLQTKQALKVAEVQTITKVLNGIDDNEINFKAGRSIPDILQVLYNCSGLEMGLECFTPNAHSLIPGDCRSFYHCDITGRRVIKQCGPGTMFNPSHSICDWPLNVYKVRPDCQGTEESPTTLSKETYSTASTTSYRAPSTTVTETQQNVKALICPKDSLVELLPEISDSAFSASSNQLISRPYLARLNPAATSEFHFSNLARSGAYLFSKNMDAWVPLTSSENEYLNIDLGSVTKVYGLEIQGSKSMGAWVSSFTLEISSDGNDFNFLTDDHGNVKVFDGAISWSSPVMITLPSQIRARYFRIRPRTWNSIIALKIELYGCSDPVYSWNVSSTTKLETSTILDTTTLYSREKFEASSTETAISLYVDVTIFPSIISPPPPCSQENQFDMLYDLEDSQFSSSSVDWSSRPDLIRDSGTDLHMFARNYFTTSEADAWAPEKSELGQYIQIDLGTSSPVYGLVVEGSEFYKAYVTSFVILYSSSEDGATYHQIMELDNQKEKVFAGSHDYSTPVEIMFAPPFEAKYIRIYPMSWINKIAMRVKLISCLKLETTPTTTPYPYPQPSTQESIKIPPYGPPPQSTPEEGTPFPVVTSTPRPIYITQTPPSKTKELRCLDELDIIGHIEVTSVLNNDLILFGPDASLIDSSSGWRPAYSSVNEVLTVYLGENVLVSGIQTKGLHSSQYWVQAFQIKYSTDNIVWMTVKNSGEKSDRIFVGNFDSDTINVQYLDMPLRATYIQIIPLKWHVAIGFRFSLLGCASESSTTLTYTTTKKDVTKLPYSRAPEEEKEEQPIVFPSDEEEEEEVVTKWIPTEDGALFRSTSSEAPITSTSKPGGPVNFPTESTSVSSQRPSTCATCPGIEAAESCTCSGDQVWDGDSCVHLSECSCYQEGIRIKPNTRVENDDCEECICIDGRITGCQPKMCPACSEGEHSEVTLYCDCICKTCDPGTKLCPTSGTCLEEALWCDGIQNCPDDELDCPKESERLSYAGLPCPKPECEPGKSLVETEIETIDGCPFYKCLLNESSDECSKPTCPEGYELRRISDHAARYSFPGAQPSSATTQNNLLGVQCPRYECVPVKSETEAPSPVIKLRSVCTYEGNIMKTFDNVTFDKEACHHTLFLDEHNDVKVMYIKECDARSCSSRLKILFQQNLVEFDTKLMVELNGNRYTADQAATFSQGNLGNIRKLGDTLLFVYDDVVIEWNCQAQVSIKVARMMDVEGLCGNNNLVSQDDWMLPSGQAAGSAQQLFDSWREEECKGRACPSHLLKNAMRLCRTVRFPPLNECKSKVEGDRFLNSCLQEICDCLQDHSETDTTCKCKIMESYVKKCREADPNVHLQNWRTMHLCPRKCPPGFVHFDCYHHTCESTCSNLRQDQTCSELDTGDAVCFPGCFCPNGLIRDGDKCVQSNQCKNCVCEKKSGLGYATFDHKSFNLLPDKKFVMSKLTFLPEEDSIEVHAVTSDCSVGYRKQICIDQVEMIYYQDTITISLNKSEDNIYLDGQHLKDSSDLPNGLELTWPSENTIVLSVLDVNYEMEADLLAREVIIRAPSLMYGKKLEGLCGDCNGDVTNDFTTVEGNLVLNEVVWVTSWILVDFSVQKHISFPEDSYTPSTLPIVQTTTEGTSYKSCESGKQKCEVLNSNIFSKCHPFVSTEKYIEECTEKICAQEYHVDNTLCDIAEQYTRECRSHDICLKFREGINCTVPECGSRSVYDECAPGCPQTCNKDVLCTGVESPGCVCKPGLVMIEGKCEPASDCIRCIDKSKRRKVNETWSRDVCTTCTCTESSGGEGEVVCTEQKCEPVICPPGYTRRSTNSSSSETCCEEQVCVEMKTEAQVQCPQLVKPDCKTFQEVHSVMENGCQKLVCECVDECPHLEPADFDLLPGESLQTVNTGCCPFLEVSCDKNSCPEDEGCPQYLVRTLNLTTKDECCPHYYCEKPSDKCLYTMRNENIGSVIAMDVSSTWKDGDCRRCKCNPARPTKECPDKSPESVCTVQKCNSRQKKLDKLRYVLEDIVVPGECCYDYKKVACIHQGNIYKMNTSWSDVTDPCKQYLCAQDNEGEADLEVKRETCNQNCNKGSKYVKEDDSRCCGECRQVECVLEDGSLLHPGDSHPIKCGEILCTIKDHQAVIEKDSVKCPFFNASCKADNVRTSDDGCCKTCVQCTDSTTGYVYDIGAEWQKDACTTCSCTDSGEILCSVVDCKEPICGIGYRIVNIPDDTASCCPRSECEPEVGPCPPLVQPDCSHNQVTRKVTAENGCISYVCECRTDCPAAVKSGDLLPGQSWSLVTSGCCPVYERSCDLTSCPPSDCPIYYLARSVQTECCPTYSCERPSDSCIHSPTNSSDSSQQILKQVGEQWNDDVCKSCSCVLTPGGPEVECSTQTCQHQPDNNNQFVYQQVNITSKCCPDWKKIACKVGDVVQEIGSVWRGASPCDEYTCERDINQDITINYKHIQCDTTCQQGYDYVIPEDKCCGHCKQTHCKSPDGQLILPNQTINIDPCKKEKCVPSSDENQFVLVEEVENCPELDPECPQQNIKISQNGCCKICVPTNDSCSLTALTETVGLISFFDDEHGNCSNTQIILDLMECKGKCQSGSKFDQRLGYHVSECTCCQQTGSRTIPVVTTCSDGVQITKDISIPSSCGCESCSEMLDESHLNEVGSDAAYSADTVGSYGGARSGLVQTSDQHNLDGKEE